MKNKDKKIEVSEAELIEMQKAMSYLNTIMDNSMDVIVITDSKGYIQKVNKYFLELVGCGQDEVIGEHIAKFGPKVNTTYTSTTGESVHIGDAFFEETWKMYERFVEEKKTINWQSYFVSKKDILIPVEENMSFFHDEKGNIVGAFAIIRDITERRKAVKEIECANKYLENIFKTSADGIMITDSEGKIATVNKAAENIFDCSSDQLVGKHFNEMRFERERLKVEGAELMTDLMNKGAISGVERTWKKLDGTPVIVEMNIALLKDDEGSMTGSVASIRDITERKKSEDTLLESEEKYRGLVNNIGIGVSLISPNMEILALNNQMQQWFPEADVSKKPICYKTFNNPPREKVCSYCPTFKTLKDGRIHESITETPQGDKTLRYRIISSPLKDKEGKITSAIEMVEDITEQKMAQEKLQESEAKYHNLIEYANDAIITTNSKGKILGFNRRAEQMFGYSREEILGKSAALLVAEQSKEEQQEEWKKLKEIGGGYDSGQRILEWMALRKNGEEFPVEFTFYSLEIGGEVIANSIVRDVSKRKKEEKKLINYQKKLKALTKELISSEQKDRQHFADFLHDEIGQQLFATRLQLEQLKGSLSSAENTQTIDTALNNLSQIMNQTRSLTSELSSPILKQLGLEKALDWLAEETHKKYNIMITFEDDKQEKPLDDNMRLLLYQAVSELLTNVAKHAKTKSASVSIKRSDSNVRICIEDKGVGFLIPNKDFSDAKNEGFGLFRIKERLEPLGGQLEIESQPNRGTKVTLVTPLDDNFQEQKT